MHTLDFWLQKASVSDDGGSISGLAAAFGSESTFRDTINPGAFSKTIAAHEARQTAPAMLYSHDLTLPIGRWMKMKETAEGLLVEGQVSSATDKAREVRQLLREGVLTGLSIGFIVPLGGAKQDGDRRVISEVDLHEISIVSTPAMPAARIREVRTFSTPREAEDALRDAGFSKTDARALMARGWRGLSSPDNAQEIRAAVERIQRATSKLQPPR